MKPRPIFRVGLTGGIASGKSTVAGLLADLGAFVIDADELAHQITAPGGAAHDAVVERFGRAILDEQGRIRRDELARIVFGDPQARGALNDIVHPGVRAEIERRIERCAASGHSPLAVVDAALLVETGSYRHYDRLIVVSCSPETQIRRLRERDGLSTEEAQARLAAQAPLEQKTALADHIIDTEGTLEETRRRTVDVYSRLLADCDDSG